jgi:glycosyltransferase involved in cell wall biosynthesis
MKVALVAPYFFPHIGGVESHVLALARELARKGHEPQVFTSRHADLKEFDSVQGIPVRRVPVSYMLFDTPLTPRLAAALQGEKWDIIHAHSPPPLSSYYAARASARSGVPLVYTHHCDPEIPTILGRAVSWVYYRTLLNYTLRRAARIIVYTESYAATSYALWKHPTALVPTGLDLSRFGPQNDGAAIRRKHGLGRKKVVLFVGRLAAHKGIQTIIEAATLTGPEVRYLLVGPGEFPAGWSRRMRQLGVEGRFVLAGKVAEPELPAYYSACDLLVLPSLSRLEAFGLVLVEAMASSRPVVASDLPGVREVIKDGKTGLLCEPFSAKDLAEKITTITSDPEAATAMGAAGRKLADEKYSWEVIGAKIEKVYEDVISGRTRRPFGPPRLGEQSSPSEAHGAGRKV